MRQERQQREEHRQQVLALGDPGDRFDLGGMDDEQDRAEQGDPALAQQLLGQQVNERAVEGVQQHVDDVVTAWVQTPDVILDPVRKNGDGNIGGEIKLGEDIGDAAHAEVADELVLAQVAVVVPAIHHAVVERVGENYDRQKEQSNRDEPLPAHPNVGQLRRLDRTFQNVCLSLSLALVLAERWSLTTIKIHNGAALGNRHVRPSGPRVWRLNDA